jgi:hypothetical protein
VTINYCGLGDISDDGRAAREWLGNIGAKRGDIHGLRTATGRRVVLHSPLKQWLETYKIFGCFRSKVLVRVCARVEPVGVIALNIARDYKLGTERAFRQVDTDVRSQDS